MAVYTRVKRCLSFCYKDLKILRYPSEGKVSLQRGFKTTVMVILKKINILEKIVKIL